MAAGPGETGRYSVSLEELERLLRGSLQDAPGLSLCAERLYIGELSGVSGRHSVPAVGVELVSRKETQSV